MTIGHFLDALRSIDVATLGTWGCYQYLPHKEPHCYNDFRGFSHVRDGYLRFPKHLQLDQYQLREIGERRAGNAKHPKTDLRLKPDADRLASVVRISAKEF